jgi:hypothetical protein
VPLVVPLGGKRNTATTIGDNLPNNVYTLKNNVQTSKVFRTIGGVYGQVNILPSLNFKTQIGIDNSMAEGFQYQNPVHGDGRNSGGYVGNSYTNQVRWNLQNILSYNKTIAGSHNLGAVLVNEFQSQNVNSFSGSGSGLADAFFRYNVISGSYGTPSSGGSLSGNGFISYAGRLNYNFKGKYFLQGSLRYDGISSLPPANRYGLFPGVSIGWTLTKESFMSGITDIVSDLKIRASYAKVGNVSIGNYPYL